MKLRNIFFLTILIICLANCSTTTSENESVNTKEQGHSIESFPKVDVKIGLNDSVTNKGEKIMLNIKLTNNESEIQKLLFDKPSGSTGGPWATTGKVTNLKTKSSVLKYENKAMLSSQIYTEDQLKDHYYNLQPGQSIEGNYALSDIVVFNSKDNVLTSGTYEVQLFYHINPSNAVRLRIK
jgi:hypothetical protein